MRPMFTLLGVAAFCFLAVVFLGGCSSTTYVPTAVQMQPHSAPAECFSAESAPADLPMLTMPAGDVTMLSLAASFAVTHRTNRQVYRALRSDARICARHLRRQQRKV